MACDRPFEVLDSGSGCLRYVVKAAAEGLVNMTIFAHKPHAFWIATLNNTIAMVVYPAFPACCSLYGLRKAAKALPNNALKVILVLAPVLPS